MKREIKIPLVSVIVTTYNRKKLLKETITSILEQTYKHFELLVIDNYSNYDFIDYINSFNDSRIRPFQNNNYGNIAINRNYGIENAKGDYIAFCDDDDLWRKDKLEKQINAIFREESLVGIGSRMTIFGETELSRNKGFKKDTYIDFTSAFSFNNCPLSSLLVRNTGQLFDIKPEFKAVEDFDFQITLLISTNKKLLLLAEPLIYYRKHKTNNSHDFDNILNSINVLKKHKHNFNNNLFNDNIALAYLNAAHKMLIADCKFKVKQFCKLAMKSTSNSKIKFKANIFIILAILPQIFRQRLVRSFYVLQKI